MPWNESTATKRIKKYLTEFQLETFEISQMVREMDFRAIAPRSGYVVQGAHIYARVLGYHDLLADQEQTEILSRRALEFLHFHYRATDLILEDEEVLRVDFHGPRLHAVVVKPYGDTQEANAERVRKAVEVSAILTRVLDQAADEANLGRARLRVGVDAGPALVVNNGSKGDRDPLFLGSPANHAAKLAAAEEEPGIYLTNRARNVLGGEFSKVPLDSTPSTRRGISYGEVRTPLSETQLSTVASTVMEGREIAGRTQRVISSAQSFPSVNFSFHRHTPPLKTIDFNDLAPSKSIRMGILSLFADLDHFTHYVDQRMGSMRDLRNAAHTLYVVRAELTDVLQSDFEGRKVRLIGDCVQGICAEGTAVADDPPSAVTTGVLCAAGMQSSFDLIQKLLPDAQGLGLVVGLDYGQTPATRLGIRGDKSIRVATSQAVTNAEWEQEGIDGSDIVAIGEDAFQLAPTSVQEVFDEYRRKQGLRYPNLSMALRDKSDVPAKHLATIVASPAVLSTGAQPRPHAQ